MGIGKKNHTQNQMKLRRKIDQYGFITLPSLKEFAGREVTVEIKPYVNNRSVAQNAYYWSTVVKTVVDSMKAKGNHTTPNAIHNFNKVVIWEFYEPVMQPDGQVIKEAKSSKKLNTEQWEQMMELTRAWYAERGLQIPLPKEDLCEIIS